MTVTAKLYATFPINAAKGNINDITHLSSVIKVALFGSGYVPDQTGDETFADVTDEMSGDGYTAGGAALASKALVQESGSRIALFDAGDVEWDASMLSGVMRAAAYDATAVSSADQYLISYVDFGEPKSTGNGTFKVQWNVSGIFSMTVGA